MIASSIAVNPAENRELTISDWTYFRDSDGNIYRYLSDHGKYGNGQPERVPELDIPESVRKHLKLD